MKKIIYFLVSFVLLINNIACTGYKPIFSSADLQFAIADHSIVGDKKLGKQIYSKLYMSSNKDSSEVKSISVLINVSKEKNATSKDSTGKILEYAVNLKINILINDSISDDVILNYSIGVEKLLIKLSNYFSFYGESYSQFLINPNGLSAYTYADCGVIPEPNTKQLVSIAYNAATTHKLLAQEQPKVAVRMGIARIHVDHI